MKRAKTTRSQANSVTESASKTSAPALKVTPPFRIVRIAKDGGSLSKRISQDASGKLDIDSSACSLARGSASTVNITGGMAELKQIYGTLGKNEAVVLSNTDLGASPREVCTESSYFMCRRDNPNVITRSKKFLAGSSEPGLQLFEVDDHGLSEGQSPPDGPRMLEILDKLLPELDVAGAASLLTHSTSSHIYDKTTGRLIKGEGGKHLAILLSDQSALPALKRLLEIRQWANGYGHIHISRDGRQLERTVFDMSVFASERLVFEAGAEMSKNLEQRRPEAIAREGHALDMSKLTSPTLKELDDARQAKAIAKEATRDSAAQTRSLYLVDEAQKLVTLRGISMDDATRIVTSRVEATLLEDGDTLTFSDTGGKEIVTVEDVLKNLEKYVGRPMHDPAEPEYGPTKAMILYGPARLPYIQSFAHGGRRYLFQSIQGKEGATSQALFSFSDLANAHRLANEFGENLIATISGWHVFTGQYWMKSEQLAEQKSLNLSRLVLKDPEYLRLKDQMETGRFSKVEESEDVKTQMEKWKKFAASCENQAKISVALKIARTLLWHDINVMNQDPWLFNVRNGTIDLRTGILRPHHRDDMITMLAPVNYIPNSPCPVFEQTLRDIFSGDDAVIGFLQRFLGYSLTGLTNEQKILIPWGDGSNGKGTILSQIQAVMGSDYCGSAPPKLLENTRTDRHPTEIADLYGKRLVIASETEEGAQLREAFLKLATGGDKLKGRFMHQDFFEFEPTHKFVLQTNYKPEVRGADYAIWRRLMLLPFEVIFGDQHAIDSGEASMLKDKDLQIRLAKEREGILAWMVKGCVEWQRQKGLNPPPKVIVATDSYREEQDRISQFLEEQCEIDVQHTSERAYAYQCYSNWARNSGYHALGINKFHKQLLRSGKGKILHDKSTTGPRKNVSIFKGVLVRP